MPPNELGHCTALVFITTFAVLCSTYLLIAVTFELLCSIIWPLKAVSSNTVKRARIIIVCIFVTCFTYCIPLRLLLETEERSVSQINLPL